MSIASAAVAYVLHSCELLLLMLVSLLNIAGFSVLLPAFLLTVLLLLSPMMLLSFLLLLTFYC